MYIFVGVLAIAGIALLAVYNVYTPLELTGLAVFLLIIALLGYQNYMGKTVTATFNTAAGKPDLDIAIATPEPLKDQPFQKSSFFSDYTQNGQGGNQRGSEQVYHVPGQYDYQDAKALCKAYGGKLATIDQITKAQEDGAEWCDYGWSEDKLALFPTQPDTWKKFNRDGTCGRPGVNGGFGMDLLQKLGANCFGAKPAKTAEFLPPSIPETEIDARVRYWKDRLPPVSPFNYQNWSA